MNKRTIVLGASPNPSRYAYMAVERLHRAGHEVYPVGIREGMIGEISIDTGKPSLSDIDTISLYLGPDKQKEWYPYILSVQPHRLLFNPGTENPELQALADQHGIATQEACTLVLLQTDQY